LLLHPVPFRNFRGDAAKLFIFLSEEESSIAWLALLALARARKLERVRVGQCRSGGIQNKLILLENGRFNKTIMTT
jgi:hypothetical protein